jgi:RNA polymerase sigma-70 factor (ECF subfamily)
MAHRELDPAALERARRGDRAAWRALVECYQGLVFATAGRVLGPASPDVPDVAQDALVKALGALADFDPRGPARLSTWIATLTIRTAIDAARRRRPSLPLDALDEAADDSLADPGEALDARRSRARLADAVAGLAPDQRAAMLLRVEHELSYEQIAAALGVEVGTVKSRLSRATAALEAALSPRRTAQEPAHG